MTIVAEVSAVIETASLVAKIGRLCLDFKNFIEERLNVQEEMDCWKKSLEDLQMYARDAETKQSNDELVWKWLKELEAMRLDIEDVIADLQYESMRREASSTKDTEFYLDDQMKKSFETIETRLQKMIDDARTLGLMCRPPSEQGPASQASDRRNRGALREEPVLFGREEEKRWIMDELLSYNNGDPEIGVLPIVGMGGIGKTTIARDVFNDERVKKFFKVRSWFGVSRDYNLFSIMKGLLDFIAGKPRSVSGSGVQNQLMEELKGKKFLIILDDLWNEKKPDWDLLMAALRGGSAGSKVIVTTRSRHVADMARTVEKYPVLGPVPLEDCWKLFCSKVGVSPKKGELDAGKEEAGKEIVRSCNGVPLAAAIFGGILRNKENLQYWENVRDKKSLRSKEGEFDMMSVMRLSYNDLPGKLKRCFALLAVFPEGHVVSWDDMEQLWSAEELIECGEIGTGRSYDFVEELVARSFLITNDTDAYVMHDMVRVLACEVAGASCCVVDDYSIERIEEIYKKGQTRYLYFRGSVCSCAKLGEHIENHSVLRFLQIRILASDISSVENEVWNKNYFSTLKYLRVLKCDGISLLQYSHLQKLRWLKICNSQICQLPDLSIWLESLTLHSCKNLVCLSSNINELKKLKVLEILDCGTSTLLGSITWLETVETLNLDFCYTLQKVPINIGNLKRLRSLKLSGTDISELPDSVILLENLETLDISDSNISKLPDNLINLHNLQYLDLSGCPIEDLPPNLRSLQDLDIFTTRDKLKQFSRQLADGEEETDGEETCEEETDDNKSTNGSIEREEVSDYFG